MAEPTNTPMPTAPGTPTSATPRSASPAPGAGSDGDSTPPASASSRQGSLVVPIPTHVYYRAESSSSSAPAQAASSAPPAAAAVPPGNGKPVVLHIGDPIRYNPATYAEFATRFNVVRPPAEQRQRAGFTRALRERRWGDFAAVYRPFWGSGGEMGTWDAELVALLPDSMRVFASAGAGFDWADVKLLGERGIIYCNSGLAAAEAVADFAAAMIISTFRVLPYCISSATSSSPEAFRECHARATSQSRNLRGQSLGLVGLGNIGQQIARRMGAGFGMAILYHDTERKPASLESALGAAFRDSLEDLLRDSDCVVVCAPGGAGCLLGAAALRRMRPGARLVNVARGSLVDEEALADALDQGRVSAVALDVHVDEPNVHPRLAAHAAAGRALLTCHNAGGTVETHAGFEELGMRNIMAVLGGGDPITPVNLEYLRKKS
ncbi:hypothetical protein DL763_006523 [Monosporascus cannonballus]|nr:hypothetical protein DL763_006523 [Monosporascus cannonballus]